MLENRNGTKVKESVEEINNYLKSNRKLNKFYEPNIIKRKNDTIRYIFKKFHEIISQVYERFNKLVEFCHSDSEINSVIDRTEKRINKIIDKMNEDYQSICDFENNLFNQKAISIDDINKYFENIGNIFLKWQSK